MSDPIIETGDGLMSIEEFKRATDARKPSKYRSVPTTFDGRRYHSKTEARRAADLKLLMDVGEVVCVVPQVRVRLGDVDYVADFLVLDRVGSVWFEDVKGFETERFKLIRRLWAQYIHLPLVVLKLKGGAWHRQAITAGD